MPHIPIDGGYQLWARKTLESEIFVDKPSDWFKLWFYLVMRVHFSEDRKLPRGSIHLKYEWIEANVGISRHTIDHFMRWAKAQSMLATRKATRGFVITLLSYAKYQDPKNYKSDSKSDSKATEKRQKSDRILQEGKNVTKKEGATGEGESAAPPPSPTPRDETQAFFASDEKQQAIISWLLTRGVSPEAAKRELDTFISYWTEPTPNGKRQRWETQPTFEIKRRLVTWFTRASKDGQRSGPKPSQQWHIAQ